MVDSKGVKDELQQAVERITNLPTPPMVFEQINRVINDPNTSAYDIAAIISEDPAMSMKVLRLSNSAFYGVTHEVTSIKQAVVLMGMETIKSMVLSTAIFGAFRGAASDPEFQLRFWRHSLAAGTCMRLLMRSVSGSWITQSELAFSAGLLHDIGKLVSYACLNDDFVAAKEFQVENKVTAVEAEEAVLGYNHTSVGALLAERWGLPDQLRHAIAYHHYPFSSGEDNSLPYLVNLADYISHLAFDSRDQAATNESLLNLRVLETLDITSDQLKPLSDSLRQEYTKAETFMQIATGL